MSESVHAIVHATVHLESHRGASNSIMDYIEKHPNSLAHTFRSLVPAEADGGARLE